MNTGDMLAHRTSGSGATLVFLHGFTQTGSSWNPVVETLSSDFTCVVVDLPGHGGSPNGCRSLVESADDVAEVVKSLHNRDGKVVLIGYSMGARVALHVALAHPHLLASLVLVSGTAGIDDASERQSRRGADDALAEHIETIGTAAFLDEWLSQPMFASLPTSAASIQDRLKNTPLGLADSLRHAGTGTQSPLWDRLGEISVPTLIVTGDLDAKFTALGERLAASIASSKHVRVSGVGHSVHLEAPETFLEILRPWLSRAS